ncbi:NAD(P)-dependent oxidoreductase [Micromonospora sp. LH3U1]|uniref:NAD(P)-dependent oxidoreductase n=1 Tax=Micromonospora sp. LH3U1 TaxID=3018339 RepID=UPI00234A5C07|nr:NAD(P)H-binding protein [Micromonospora sp. LH3U1]WCN79414.1 NAD(P)H-binding protein [Micromonospora sp. LH3U1]
MSSIAVFGAGGRAGRATTAEARQRGHTVTAVVRDPDKHRGITADRVLRGDVRDAASVAAVSSGHDAVVNAVSPASDPEALAGLAHLDEQFFVSSVDALLLGMERAEVGRLVLIGLFANLVDHHGRAVLDDPTLFPHELRPFALAHTAGLERLRSTGTTVDWVMLTPPALLDAAAPRTGQYRIGGETLPEGSPAGLSYADLAVAIVDEIDNPLHHRMRISVFD